MAYKEYEYWEETFSNLYDKVGLADNDPIAQQGYFNALHPDSGYSHRERDAFYEYFLDYVQNEYGIDFEEEFDWEAFRDWYGSA